jgi:O-acetylhomoserine (thiol)-lyase
MSSEEEKKQPQGFDTIALHGGYDPDPHVVLGLGQGAPRGVPVYRTTPYVFKNTQHAADLFKLKELGNIYSRIMNPTNHVLESRYAQLEGGHPLSGLTVSSGTTAIFYSIINLASAGDNIVSARALYGGTFTMFNDILKKFGVEVRFVDAEDPNNFDKVVDDKTRAFFCESCSNPALEICDLEEIAKIAHKHGLPLICDSTFSTPYLCKPFDFGVDIVVSSLTKWIGGHGAGLGGIIVDKGGFNWGGGKHPIYDEPDTSYSGMRWGHDLPESLAPLSYILRCRTVPLRNLGGCMSPDNAWIIIQGIETLSLRMERHVENALKVALHLKDHPGVAWVRYPGLPEDPQYDKAQKYLRGTGGPMVVFGIRSDDGKKAGELLIDSLKLFSHVANVGDARSLAIHPASTTHSQLTEKQMKDAGCPPDMVRLSVGIESISDILADLDQALDKAKSA